MWESPAHYFSFHTLKDFKFSRFQAPGLAFWVPWRILSIYLPCSDLDATPGLAGAECPVHNWTNDGGGGPGRPLQAGRCLSSEASVLGLLFTSVLWDPWASV